MKFLTSAFLIIFILWLEQKVVSTFAHECFNPRVHSELMLKMAVFADHALHHRFVKEYGRAEANEKLKDYVFTLLHHTQQLFTNLRPSIKLIVVEYEVFENKLRHVSEKRLKQNMAYYMDMFCHYQKNRNHRKRWHHAVLLSGFDLVYGNEDEFSGYSTAESVCRPVSCSIVEATSFKSAYTLAHEIGHAFGMKHDNGSHGCQPGCCLMSPVIYSGTYSWSECSRYQMEHYLRTIPCKSFCLADYSAHGLNFVSSTLPGQKFTLDDQCRTYLGSCYQHYLTQGKDISSVCESLWCTSGENFAKEAHAALEGSYCGNRKWCIGGQCVRISREYVNDVGPVDGQWTEWKYVTQDGKCGSVGCSNCQVKGQTRVRRQVRMCSNPSPNNGGRTCDGGSVRGILCDQDPNVCNGMSSLHYATHQCKRRRSKPAYISVNLTGEGFQNVASEFPCLIWCKTTSPTYSAYTFFDPMPDGSYCGEKKACMAGKCMNIIKCQNDVSYVTDDKAFIQECSDRDRISNNDWSEWSSCSATCGVGFRYRSRKCPTKSCPKSYTKSYQWCRSKTVCYSANTDVRVAAFLNNSQKSIQKHMSTSVPRLDSNEITIDEPSNTNVTEHLDNTLTTDSELSANFFAPTESPREMQMFISPKWSEWESWTDCTTTCDIGVQYAKRKCLSSSRKKCKGSSIKRRVCNIEQC